MCAYCYMCLLFQASLPSHKAPTSQWAEFRSALLRPIVTGNWGCGAFAGDPQLKALLQWMAVSLSGRPEMVYCTFYSLQLRKVCVHMSACACVCVCVCVCVHARSQSFSLIQQYFVALMLSHLQLSSVVELVEKRGMNIGQLAKLTLKCCAAMSHRQHHHGNSGQHRLFPMLIQELS